MDVGKMYYIVAHAYWHFVGEVTEVLGPKTVRLKNVRQVHRCERPWTKFFAEGFGKDTRYDTWPDGTEVTAILHTPWEHPIP